MGIVVDHKPQLSDRDFKRVVLYIETTAGIQLPDAKRYLVEGRLNKRLRTLGYNDFSDYLDYALETPEGQKELDELVDAITTNKTDFYREKDHFDFMQTHIIEPLATQRDIGWKRPLRVWSAACSSGEEPYTLAIELKEAQRRYPGFKFEIIASDISRSSLKTAKQGIYPEERIQPVPLTIRQRYFLRGRDAYQGTVKMDKELRETIQFGVFNLLSGNFSSVGYFDLIFCRNVMIYFSHEDRRKLINDLISALNPGGYLFVGHAESLNGLSHEIAQQIPTVYRKL